ncbi:hypothetical protein B0H14DRAFT_261062 [Mycena olivaceomarginata]|nr:hypothetical protein B0H14DRAFT_261062 [Mycena olivaceomarginata]
MHTAPRPQWSPPQPIKKNDPPMVFAPPRAMKPIPATKFGAIATSASGSRPQFTPPRGAGYFAFPPNSPAPVTPQIPSEDLAAKREEEAERQRQKALDDAWAARRVRDEAARKARLEAEAAEALKGEIDWVRSGGILRDAKGNRDYARTKAIREELRLSALEAVLVERWQKYEARWADLAGKAGRDRDKPRDVQFQDVPWPVSPPEGQTVTLADLTVDRVEEFLLTGLKVRGCTVTKKERVRTSLLRWHPDKMTAVLARIVETDLETVRQGIHAVVLCLHQLNSKVETA